MSRNGIFSLFISIMVLACLLSADASESTTKKAPDFTLRTTVGKNFTLSEYIGKGPIVISFWATWCAPCHAEMKEMVKIYNTYKNQGLKVVTVSIDDQSTMGKVKSFMAARKYPFITPLDPQKKVYTLFHVSNVPQVYVIGNDGKIVYSHTGYVKGDEKKLDEKIAELINKKEE